MKRATISSLSSFPSSAWERRSAKLCFASRAGPDAKQSFAPVRSQAELGNERQAGLDFLVEVSS